ncbi:MAG TPA: hypothetical protein VIN02_07900 [Sulfurovum sp.]
MRKLFAILSMFTVIMAYASNENSVNSMEEISNSLTENVSYKHMSTAQLQEEVERRSINGDLSFDMGLELIKRWSNK